MQNNFFDMVTDLTGAVPTGENFEPLDAEFTEPLPFQPSPLRPIPTEIKESSSRKTARRPREVPPAPASIPEDPVSQPRRAGSPEGVQPSPEPQPVPESRIFRTARPWQFAWLAFQRGQVTLYPAGIAALLLRFYLGEQDQSIMLSILGIGGAIFLWFGLEHLHQSRRATPSQLFAAATLVTAMALISPTIQAAAMPAVLVAFLALNTQAGGRRLILAYAAYTAFVVNWLFVGLLPHA